MTTSQGGDPWDPGNPENGERIRRRKAELRNLLLQWDPIGVGEAPEAQDEYDGYLGPLLHFLHDGSSVEEVSAHLNNVVEGMGITPRPDREQHFAETLVAWWANTTG